MASKSFKALCNAATQTLLVAESTLEALTVELADLEPLAAPTVFELKRCKPGTRWNRIEAAVVAGGRHARGPHEAIAADPFKGGFRVLITGPQGFERTVAFAMDDEPAVIADRVRETLEY
jgi:hypothetical protein